MNEPRPQTAAGGGPAWGPAVRRGLIWGILVAALAVVALATFERRGQRAAPPPILGEVPAFSLTNRDGRTVSRDDLAGTPWIADLLFTRCTLVCPAMTARMARLDRTLPAEGLRLVSLSIDPEHDTPQVLEAFASAVDASDRWLFLTGDLAVIDPLVRDGLKLAVDRLSAEEAPDPGTRIVHSDRFLLIDPQGRIRGYYDPFDPASIERLEHDLAALSS